MKELRAYAIPEEFKGNQHYPVDNALYQRVGGTGFGQAHTTKHVPAELHGGYVKAHWNIHQGGYSVKPPNSSSTLAHAESLHLGGPDGVRFEVNESGRRRVLDSGTKNPHAFVHGILQETDIDASHIPVDAFPIGYSPHHGHFFKVESGEDGRPKPGEALHRAGDVYMLPPHPDAQKGYQDKMQAARANGENMSEWKRKNKAPIGRVYATPHKEER